MFVQICSIKIACVFSGLQKQLSDCLSDAGMCFESLEEIVAQIGGKGEKCTYMFVYTAYHFNTKTEFISVEDALLLDERGNSPPPPPQTNKINCLPICASNPCITFHETVAKLHPTRVNVDVGAKFPQQSLFGVT